MKHNFGERTEEMGMPVWQSPKFVESRAKAIELIESGKYGLTDADFWILMNKTKSNKMAYTGLIITHNGCCKINDAMDDGHRFKSQYLTREFLNNPILGGETIVFTYNDGNLYEIGSANASNCKNPYMLEMAYKRCFDRAVLKLSKVAFGGIYAEDESDDFKTSVNEERSFDPVTGEVIETAPIPVAKKEAPASRPVPAKAPAPVAKPAAKPAAKAPVNSTGASTAANAADQVKVKPIEKFDDMTLEQALAFVTTSTNQMFAGKRFLDILSLDKEMVMKWLPNVVARAKPQESAAAKLVLNGIKSGELMFEADLPY